MSEANSTTPAAGKDDLKLVVFGLPAAGKSSLLGALGESSKSQERLLGGRLIDRTGGLTELADQLYTERLGRTAEEVVPFPVEYEPFSLDGLVRVPTKTAAVLMDCDGGVANELLVSKQPLAEDSPEGKLAYEVGDADALILLVDASAPPRHIEVDFSEFRRFLKIMERSRGQRAEVGGLPVFLVLTKCDLLVKPGDTSVSWMEWMERIEQRKRDVDAHFREFLDLEENGKSSPKSDTPDKPKGPEENPSPLEEPQDEVEGPSANSGRFGRIDLHIWATAVKRPALLGAPAKPREPYGVAELFRQCLTEAKEYRERSERSERRLMGTLIGTVSLVVGMLVLAGVLLMVNRSSRAAALEARVDDFRFLDKGGPAERLKGSPEQLEEKAGRLQKMRDDPLFSDLKQESRDFVEERLEELHDYIPYRKKVQDERLPSEERTQEGLERRIERLKKDLAPPQPEWAGTDAALEVRHRLDGGEALKQAIRKVTDEYQSWSESATKLWTFADYRTVGEIDWSDWTAQVDELVDPARRFPFNEDDPIPGAPGSRLTYRTAMRFDKSADARSAWESERTRLRRLLQMCSALGLAPPSKERPAVLVFSRTFPLGECRVRVEELKKFYPDFQTNFVREALPDTILPRVRRLVRSQYQNLLIPGRSEVLRQLQLSGSGKEETVSRWEAVRLWLTKPEELDSWRVLANVLLRLADPTAPDPVTSMATFLGQKRFLIEIRTLTVEIPIGSLKGLRPRAESRFILLHPASNRQPALAFEPSGERRRDSEGRVWLYTYRVDTSVGRSLTYHPGDKLWAELPLSGGKERLVWADTRSMLYQFERLRNPPRLQGEGATSLTDGRRQDDVRVRFSPEDGVPRVPDLMPEVRLE